MRILREFGRVLLWNLVVAAGATILLQVFREDVNIQDAGKHFEYSLVYTFCISVPAWLSMDRIARRVLHLSQFLQIPLLIGALAVFALAGSVAANLIFLALGWQTMRNFWGELRYGLRIALFVTIVVGLISIFFEILRQRLQAATEELRRRKLEDERARQLIVEARLSSLESRIHPHFLFNTLNSISALIREDPRQAERTVERLAALLRYSLDHHARGVVPLRQEVHVVEDYLEIERTRFGDRLQFSFDVPAELSNLEVPPLAVQCLVENSIKHAIAVSRQGGEVRVAARLTPGGLLLEVSDDGPGFDRAELERGHGLENLAERLAALFDGAGRLEIARRGDRMVVSVLVPQKKVLA